MNREELYENEDAYTELINWKEKDRLTSSLCLTTAFTGPFKGVCHMDDEDNDAKNNLSYSFSFDNNGKTNGSSRCKRLIIEASNNRKLTMEYADLLDSDEIVLTYKLGDKDLVFNITLDGDNRHNSEKITLKDIKTIKISYDGLEFSKSLLKYSITLLAYGDDKEAEKAYEMHKMIVDKLITNVFTKEELKMFYDNIRPIISESRSQTYRDINAILRSMNR